MLKEIVHKHHLVSRGIEIGGVEHPSGRETNDRKRKLKEQEDLDYKVKSHGAKVQAMQFLEGLKSEANETKIRTQDSCNSLPFDHVALEGLIRKNIREYSIPMPPTREGLEKLFVCLNVAVSIRKCIDCVVYCRGKKMELANQDEFDFQRLLKWFMLNIRTFKHLNEEIVDKEWIEETKYKEIRDKKSLVAPSWKPHPQAFIRRGTGTGGQHYSRILKSRGLKVSDSQFGIETASKAF